MTDTRFDRPGAAWDGSLPRRDFLRAAGILGSLTIGVGASACAEDGASRGTNNRDRIGGTFSAALANPFPNLEPSVVPYTGAIVSSWFWGERLYRVDQYAPRDELLPELAVAMPEQVSPTTYRVAVREGVTFHDGNALSAEDVEFTYNWIRNSDTGSLWPQFLGFLADVRATDEYEVEFELTAPSTLLTLRLVLVPIRPRTATAPFELEPIGTGPYRVVSAVSDQEIVMERFEQYNGHRDVSFDRLELVRVADANARVAGLRSGQFAMIEDVSAGALKQLAETPGMHAEAVDSYVWTVLYFNCGKPPFDDVRVRQAVMYAIDREAVAQAAFFGHAEPAWAGFISPEHPEFSEPRTVHRYDPGHAKQLVTEAGLAGSAIPIDVVYHSDYEFAPAQLPIIEQNLRDIGFDPTVNPMEFSAADTRMVEGDYHLTVNGPADWSLFAPDLEFLLRGSFTGFVTQQMVFWNGAEANDLQRLLDEATAAPDGESRHELLGAAQDLVQEQVPIGALFHKKQLTGWSDELRGYRPLPTAGVALDGVATSS